MMPTIQIKPTNPKKVPSPLPTSKNIIKYKDLLEGIGHQVIAKIMVPINNNNLISFNKNTHTPGAQYNYRAGTSYHSQHTHATPGLKQLTGFITLLYVVIILIICFGMSLVYLIWPEEHSLLRRMMLTALPFMVFFTLSILFCYIYLNRSSFCSNLSNMSNSCFTGVRNFSQNCSFGFNQPPQGLGSLGSNFNRKATRSNQPYEKYSTVNVQYDNNTCRERQPVSSSNSSNNGDVNVCARSDRTHKSKNLINHSQVNINIDENLKTPSRTTSIDLDRHDRHTNGSNINGLNNNNNSSTYGSSHTHSQSSFERSFDENMYRYQNDGGHRNDYVTGQYNNNIVNVPMWQEPDYRELEDDKANSYKNVSRVQANLEFLKYKD